MHMSKKLRNIIICIITFFVVVFPIVFTFYMKGSFQQVPTVEEKQIEGKVLKVAAPLDYAPYTFLDKEGNPSGRDVELAYMIGKELGYKVEVEAMSFYDCIQALQIGQIDLIMGKELSSIADNEGLAVSVPTADDDMMIWGRGELKDLSVLAGKRIGVINSATYVNTLVKMSDCIPVEMESYDDLFDAFSIGEIDYLLCRNSVGRIIRDERNVDIQELLPCYKSFLGFAATENNSALIAELDMVISDMKHSGKLYALNDKWFGYFRNTKTFFEVLKQYVQYYMLFLAVWIVWGTHLVWLVRVSYLNAERERLHMEFTRSVEEANTKLEITNRDKSVFLMNLSHDIRTPMNSIVGFTDLLERNLDNPEKAKNYLEKIKYSTGYMMDLIGNVLELTRLDSGHTHLEENPWDLETLWDSVKELLEASFAQKNVELVFDLRMRHKMAYCDITKLKEIYINLLSNSLKFTDGGGSVKVTFTEQDGSRDGYGYFKTVIADTGCGMTQEQLAHVFDDYSSDEIMGTRLGLPVVQRLVQLMSGTIHVSSEEGVGTTFTINIPHRLKQHNARRKSIFGSEASGVGVTRDVLAGKRVLLAEDNDLNAEIEVEILKSVHVDVERVADGEMCVELLKRSRSGYYDMILMDIEMPKMNGYEATEIIRALPDQDKAQIPILAMTANALDQDKKKALEIGMSGHIAKPIDVPRLMEMMAMFIKK